MSSFRGRVTINGWGCFLQMLTISETIRVVGTLSSAPGYGWSHILCDVCFLSSVVLQQAQSKDVAED